MHELELELVYTIIERYKSMHISIGVSGAYKVVDKRVDEVLKRIVDGEVVIIHGKRVLCAKKVPGNRRYRVLVVFEDGSQEIFLPSKFLEAIWKT